MNPEIQLQAKFDYFSIFDKIIVYYDYGQVELAQIRPHGKKYRTKHGVCYNEADFIDTGEK